MVRIPGSIQIQENVGETKKDYPYLLLIHNEDVSKNKADKLELVCELTFENLYHLSHEVSALLEQYSQDQCDRQHMPIKMYRPILGNQS